MADKHSTSIVVRSVVVVPATNQGCSQTSDLARPGSVLPERFISTSDLRNGMGRELASSPQHSPAVKRR
jgi:hypothetical protein